MIRIDPDVFTYQPELDMSKETFVVTGVPDPAPVVEALERVAGRFMQVDETGVEHPDDESALAALHADLYTPNWVSDPEVTDEGVRMYVDCKGVVADPMAATFHRILTEELTAVGYAGRISAVSWG